MIRLVVGLMCSVVGLVSCIPGETARNESTGAYGKALREFKPGSPIPRADPKRKVPAPPVAGNYLFDTTVDGRDGELTFEASMTVKHPRPLEGGSLEVTNYSQDEYDDSTYSIQIWHHDGVFTKSSSWARNEYPACTYSPPYKELEFPMKVGNAWSASSKCDQTENPRLYSARFKVLREESLELAGEKVETYVFDAKWSILTVNENIEGQTTNWYSPKYGVVVKYESSATRRGHQDPKPKNPFKARSLIRSTQPSSSDAV